MKVVIADTSPLNYLVLIGSVDILPALYREVLVPEQVVSELMDPLSPLSVKRWLSSSPEWLKVQVVEEETADLRLDDGLDPGERAAILLASCQREEVLLLMDDAAGRAAARRIGIATVGTLGLLRLAADQGLVNLPVALNRLTQTNFRISERLLADLIGEKQ